MRRFDLVGDIHQDDAPNQGKITNPIAKRKSCNKHPFQTALYLSPPPSVQVSDMFFELLFFLVCRTEDHLRLWRRKNRLENLPKKNSESLPALKPKWPLEIVGWKMKFPFGIPYFQVLCRYVSFREGMYIRSKWNQQGIQLGEFVHPAIL